MVNFTRPDIDPESNIYHLNLLLQNYSKKETKHELL